jgi:hypothetical protein
MIVRPRCAALALACWASVLSAHHSQAMIDATQPVWVKGKVVEFRVMHPHVMIELEVAGKGGAITTWHIEGPNLMRLERMGLGEGYLKRGDVIEACGFHLRQPYTKPEFVHGQVLVLPDGRMRYWGPYGKLESCIRPGDTAEKWAGFLKEDAMALPSWCSGHGLKLVPSVAPAALVEEIDRRAGKPCG